MAKAKRKSLMDRLGEVPVRTSDDDPRWLSALRVAAPEDCAELMTIVERHNTRDPEIRSRFSSDEQFAEWIVAIVREMSIQVKPRTVCRWLCFRRSLNGQVRQ